MAGYTDRFRRRHRRPRPRWWTTGRPGPDRDGGHADLDRPTPTW